MQPGGGAEAFGLDSEQEYLDHFNLLSRNSDRMADLSSEKAERESGKRCRWDASSFTGAPKTDGELIPAEITLVRIDGLEEDGSAMVAGYTEISATSSGLKGGAPDGQARPGDRWILPPLPVYSGICGRKRWTVTR